MSNSRQLRRHGDLREMTEMEKHSLHGRVETKFERAPKALIERLGAGGWGLAAYPYTFSR